MKYLAESRWEYFYIILLFPDLKSIVKWGFEKWLETRISGGISKKSLELFCFVYFSTKINRFVLHFFQLWELSWRPPHTNSFSLCFSLKYLQNISYSKSISTTRFCLHFVVRFISLKSFLFWANLAQCVAFPA